MADFQFTVDTTEMATAIRGVSGHVTGVTAAVVTMQTAVIQAEKAGAERICRDVDRGFYSLVRSQIGQRMATLRSKVDSRVMEMRQQSVSIAAVRTRMERDFAMIAARYAKLFRSLDANLRGRVFELDRAAVTLQTKEWAQLSSRASAMQATVPIHQSESVSAREGIIASRVKANAARAITAMHGFVSEAAQQRLLVGRVLGGKTVTGNGVRYLPAVVFATSSFHGGEDQWAYRMSAAPDIGVAKKVEREVSQSVYGDLASRLWCDLDPASRERVAASFRRRVDGTTLSERVRGHVMRLFAQSSWQRLAEAEESE